MDIIPFVTILHAMTRAACEMKEKDAKKTPVGSRISLFFSISCEHIY